MSIYLRSIYQDFIALLHLKPTYASVKCIEYTISKKSSLKKPSDIDKSEKCIYFNILDSGLVSNSLVYQPAAVQFPKYIHICLYSANDALLYVCFLPLPSMEPIFLRRPPDSIVNTGFAVLAPCAKFSCNEFHGADSHSKLLQSFH